MYMMFILVFVAATSSVVCVSLRLQTFTNPNLPASFCRGSSGPLCILLPAYSLISLFVSISIRMFHRETTESETAMNI